MFGNERFLLLDEGEELEEKGNSSLYDSTRTFRANVNSVSNESGLEIEIIDFKESGKESPILNTTSQMNQDLPKTNQNIAAKRKLRKRLKDYDALVSGNRQEEIFDSLEISPESSCGKQSPSNPSTGKLSLG